MKPKAWIFMGLILAAVVFAAYWAAEYFKLLHPRPAVKVSFPCNLDRAYPLLLKVRPHAQETPVWCWAASFQMILEFLKGSPNQCEMANDIYDSANRGCCLDALSPPASACSKDGATVDQEKQILQKYTSSYQWKDYEDAQLPDPLTWKETVSEICSSGRPFAYSYKDVPTSDPPTGHMSVVIGYYTEHYAAGNKQQWLVTLNPCISQIGNGDCLSDQEHVPYEYYADNVTHVADFYAIVPK